MLSSVEVDRASPASWRQSRERERRAAADALAAELVECHDDLGQLFDTLARRVVELIGEGCVITTITSSGAELEPRVVLHADPVVDLAMQEVLAGERIRIGEGIAGTAAADRRSVVLNDLPPETLADATPDRFSPFARDHPMLALMIVPLVASGELLGTLGVMRTTSTAPYEVEDLRLLRALAGRAAETIVRARRRSTLDPDDHEAIYEHHLDGLLVATPDGTVLAANPAACTALRLPEHVLVGVGLDTLFEVSDGDLPTALADLAAVGQARSELAMRRADGTTFVAAVWSNVYVTAAGSARTCVGFRDVGAEVAEREAARIRLAELEQAADRDPLTGLWNRRGFGVAAEQALARADREGSASQLVFLDIDRLKQINDGGGHAVGDAVIVAVADAITAAVRAADVACRLGGDEFLVLAVGTTDEEVQAVVQRIDRALTDASVDSTAITVTAGTAGRPPGDTRSLQDLIDEADRSMYQRKVLRRLSRQEEH